MEFELGELFCGAGGIGWAASQAEVYHDGVTHCIKPTWANDKDPEACQTYDHNIHDGQGREKGMVVAKDVDAFMAEDLPRLPSIDAFAFGFPCNDYSHVGLKRGLEGDYGQLYLHGVKVLERHRPRWFLAENVGGLRSASGGRALEQIMQQLSEAGPGYQLTVHRYRFEEYGVPQRRHRIIMVGVSKEEAEDLKFEVPAPTNPSNPITARAAIDEPPIAAADEVWNHEFSRQTQRVIDRLTHTPAGKNAWCEDIPEQYRLHVKTAHLSQIYKRLEADKPAYTLTGSGGGGTHGYHWAEPRALTNRERARLQSFPDHFRFFGRKDSVRRQIGMAVPPSGVQVIFEAILKTFAGVPYEFVESNMICALQKALTL